MLEFRASAVEHTGSSHDRDAGAGRRHAGRRRRGGAGGRDLPRQPPDLHRRGGLRARDEAHLRGQLDLPRAREPGAGPRGLPHDVHRAAAGRHHP
ncbi:hypothetical protein [Nocardioides convexus]|uniref:hypothetical protein n=1 Tax=Nocardioides convexus TaxID=2712224 RepID=UPI002418663A|nr:hypothetical protein [Nocardioides convexus]